MRSLASTALCLLVSATLGGVAWGQPTPAPSPSPTTTPLRSGGTATSPLVGWYTLTRQGADALQTMTLHLRGDGIVSLRTALPGYEFTAAGTPVMPVYQTGTWTAKEGRAAIHFDMTSNIVDGVPTDQRIEAAELTLELSGCSLRLVADPAKAYGSAGLTFAKQQCTP